MAQPILLTATAADVLAFWREAGPSRWFRKDAEFDEAFRARFLAAHETAARHALDAWSNEGDGALALVILLDQFPRNAFRNSARMFATDAQARDVAHKALALGFDAAADAPLRNFFYLPFMHSEDLTDQDLAVQLCRPLGDEAMRYAVMHREIIEEFGRFPHRNAVLGRTTTPDERKFLEAGGFAG